MLAVSNAGAQATSAHLAGVVVTETGDPLADVVLSIGRSDATARTDANGRFELSAVPWGQVRLHARALGFAPKDTVMSLQSGLSYSILFRLVKFVPQLDTVQLQASLAYGKPARYRHTGKFDDFYERRAKRPGSFFTREDIERSGRARVSELISSSTGITLAYRVTPKGMEPHLRVARCTATGGTTRVVPLAVYINGQRIGDGINLTSDIETLEVYRGPTQLPLEAMGDACAAVFITTRYSPGSVLTGNR